MLMKGAIGFSRKKGWLAKLVRWLSKSPWDCAFIITSVAPDIMVAESSSRGVYRTKITKYESSLYTTTFFFPEKISDDAIERGVQSLAATILCMIHGRDAVRDFILFYLRAMDPGDPWDAMSTGPTSVEDIFNELSVHPSFKAITSS